MKLLSTEIGENRIELTYADNADLDAAERLVIVRLPTETNDAHSVALNRYVALKELQEFIRKQVEIDRATSDRIR